MRAEGEIVLEFARCFMYGILTYISPKLMVNVGKYSSPMEHMHFIQMKNSLVPSSEEYSREELEETATGRNFVLFWGAEIFFFRIFFSGGFPK